MSNLLENMNKYLEKVLKIETPNEDKNTKYKMIRKFVQTSIFERDWKILGLGDDALRIIEQELRKNPKKGDVIEGTGGARKIRITLNNKGKRGGGRVIYVDILQMETIYLIQAYTKADQSDINQEQKKNVKELIDKIKEENN